MLIKRLISLGLLPLILGHVLITPFAIAQNANQNLTESLVQQNPFSLLQQGKKLYQNQQYSQAAGTLQQAIVLLSEQGDQLNQAIALSNLSLVWQQLGKWQEAEETLNQSLALISASSDPKKPLILAQILTIQGQLQLAKGQTENAIATWKQTAQLYTEAGDLLGTLQSQINQAAALQVLGLYRQALTTLQTVNNELKSKPDSPLKITALLNLGNASRRVGNFIDSKSSLQQSLDLAQSLNDSQSLGEIYLNLGNTYQSNNQLDLAIKNYQAAVQQSPHLLTRTQAQLNLLSLFIQLNQIAEAEKLVVELKTNLAQLPPSRSSVYAWVNFANQLIKIENNEKFNPKKTKNLKPIVEVLITAIQQSKLLQDPRAESYSLGSLGKLYEENNQVLEAQKLTEKALIMAQSIQAADISYQWQWQLGRVLNVQGKRTDAIAAYREAVNTLQTLRKDLVDINQDVQFSFRESVEPVYRQLVDLILQSSSPENLQEARELIESLQLAELDNFFREACLDQTIQPQTIDEIDPKAAIIYPIILSDRLEVIVSIPGQSLFSYSTPIPEPEVEKIVRQLQESFIPIFSTQQRLTLSQQVYNWLIAPAEDRLKTHQISTLVFVLDGSLRNLPMSALYNGKNYLIQNYNISLTPGLQLLAPRALKSNQIKALTVGLSEARQGFSALPAVEFEVEQIQDQLPSQVLLNQEFTQQAIENLIQKTNFPIVHLATHGQFSSKAEETFLLTWDGRINVKDLDQLLRSREQGTLNPVELLVLSACETATGDQRAALGLAGVAVRSGARSTLATLWQVNDVSTAELMTEFYQQLASQQVSKAEALRRAQLKLLQQPKYQDPYYWAPFVLVGNWL